jgi:hypothetical protein
MRREELVQLLDRDAESYRECRDALTNGASFKIWAETQPAATLASIYVQRAKHTAKRGMCTLSFAGAVATLLAADQQPLRLGAVRTAQPPTISAVP